MTVREKARLAFATSTVLSLGGLVLCLNVGGAWRGWERRSWIGCRGRRFGGKIEEHRRPRRSGWGRMLRGWMSSVPRDIGGGKWGGGGAERWYSGLLAGTSPLTLRRAGPFFAEATKGTAGTPAVPARSGDRISLIFDHRLLRAASRPTSPLR